MTCSTGSNERLCNDNDDCRGEVSGSERLLPLFYDACLLSNPGSNGTDYPVVPL